MAMGLHLVLPWCLLLQQKRGWCLPAAAVLQGLSRAAGTEGSRSSSPGCCRGGVASGSHHAWMQQAQHGLSIDLPPDVVPAVVGVRQSWGRVQAVLAQRPVHPQRVANSTGPAMCAPRAALASYVWGGQGGRLAHPGVLLGLLGEMIKRTHCLLAGTTVRCSTAAVPSLGAAISLSSFAQSRAILCPPLTPKSCAKQPACSWAVPAQARDRVTDRPTHTAWCWWPLPCGTPHV